MKTASLIAACILAHSATAHADRNAFTVWWMSDIGRYCNDPNALQDWLTNIHQNAPTLTPDEQVHVLQNVGGQGELYYDFRVSSVPTPERAFKDLACGTPEPGLQCAATNGMILKRAAEAMGFNATTLTSAGYGTLPLRGAHVSVIISRADHTHYQLLSFNTTPVNLDVDHFKDISQREAEAGRLAASTLGATIAYTMGDRVTLFKKQGAILTDKVLGRCREDRLETLGDGSSLLQAGSGHFVGANMSVEDEGKLAYLGYTTCHKNGHGTWDIGIAMPYGTPASPIKNENAYLLLNYSREDCRHLTSTIDIDSYMQIAFQADLSKIKPYAVPASAIDVFGAKLTSKKAEIGVQGQFIPSSYNPVHLPSGHLQHWEEASVKNEKENSTSHLIEQVGAISGPLDSTGSHVVAYGLHFEQSKAYGKMVAEIQANCLSRAMTSMPSGCNVDFSLNHPINSEITLYGSADFGNGPKNVNVFDMRNFIKPQFGTSSGVNFNFGIRRKF